MRKATSTSSKEAITEPAVTISPSATVREALEALLSSDGTRLLVCPGGLDVAEGVVTDFDLVTILAGPVP